MQAKHDPSDNISGQVVIATVLSFIMATTAVALRLWSRRLQDLKFRADDYCILAALFVKYGITITGTILIYNGFGTHVEFVSPSNLSTFLQVLYTGPFVYSITIMFVKLSILLLYHRIFSFYYVRVGGIILGIITIFWCIAVCVTGVIICTPIRKAWDPTVSGHCVNLLSFYYGLQIPNIVTDACDPGATHPSNMGPCQCRRRHDFILLGLFTVGILTVAFDVVRLAVMVKLTTGDITYDTVAGGIWTDIEPSVAIVAACLPIMRPILRKLVGDHSARIHVPVQKKIHTQSDGSERLKSGGTVSSGGPRSPDDCEMQGRRGNFVMMR